MRASRLVSLVLVLQARGRATAQELAAELGVSVRTTYRDIEALQGAGVPVYGEPGTGGGYRLVDGYRTRLTGLTPAEAKAIVLVGLPGAAEALGRGQSAAAVRHKLLAAIPPELATLAARSAAAFHLDSSSWYGEAAPTPHLGTVAAAVRRQRAIELTYHRWRAPETVVRTVAPLGLVLKTDTWYLVAARLATGGGATVDPASAATYRVSAIREVRATGQHFVLSADFDLAGYWAHSVAAFEQQRLHQMSATLSVVTPDALGRLRAHHVAAISRAAQVADHDPATGELTVTIPLESVQEGLRVLLPFGASIQVLSPPELREEIKRAVDDLSALYADPGA